MSDAAHFFAPIPTAQLDISSVAIKTAFFLAEILFGYTLAMKSIYFLASQRWCLATVILSVSLLAILLSFMAKMLCFATQQAIRWTARSTNILFATE